MKHCNICKVEVDTHSDICPLCYNKLTEIEPKTTPELFELKEEDKSKKAKTIIAKIFLILSIAISCICGFINYRTNTIAWSLVVIAGIAYLWVLVGHNICSRRSPFEKVFLQVASVSGFLLLTNHIFSSNDWLVSYVFPSISMLVVCTMTFEILIRKSRTRVLFSFFSIEILLIFTSVLMLVLKLDDFKLLNQINIIFTTIVAMSYLLFGWRTIKTEFVRKFHL